jgi:hypothetical protein
MRNSFWERDSKYEKIYIVNFTWKKLKRISAKIRRITKYTSIKIKYTTKIIITPNLLVDMNTKKN